MKSCKISERNLEHKGLFQIVVDIWGARGVVAPPVVLYLPNVIHNS